MSREVITKNVEHPLEDIFELPSGSTEISVIQRRTEVVAHVDFDNKDSEIEQQFQEVYDVAMSTFENTVDLMERSETDPKYVARQMEVAAQYLNTALAAAKEKANLKQGKDKLLAQARTAASTMKSNEPGAPVVMDHATLLKLIKGEKPESETQVVDGEFEEKK